MIGRYANVSKYRELLMMKEFYMVSSGILLIIASYLLEKMAYIFPADILALTGLALLGGPIILGATRGLLKKELNVDGKVVVS